MKVSMVSKTVAGHRGEYETLFAQLIHDAGGAVRLRRGWTAAMVSREPVFFLMIEDQFYLYLMTAFARSLLGLRTVGLLFRGRQALQARGGRRRARRIALRLLKRLPQVRTLSITSFDDDPCLEAIADDWLFDPQLWDLVGRDISLGSSDLSDAILGVAAGRKVVIAMGYQTAGKGFPEFAELWLTQPRVREDCLFVSAGGVNAGLKPLAAKMADAGAIIVDRHITEAELFSLYGAASSVWACYAPNYDQSSGILGRALQLGVPSIIRRGAQVSARTDDASTLQLSWDSPAQWATHLLEFNPCPQPAASSSRMKAKSIATLLAHLGLTP